MTRPSWDFDYRSMPPGALDEQSLLEEMVIATFREDELRELGEPGHEHPSSAKS